MNWVSGYVHKACLVRKVRRRGRPSASKSRLSGPGRVNKMYGQIFPSVKNWSGIV